MNIPGSAGERGLSGMKSRASADGRKGNPEEAFGRNLSDLYG